MKKIMIGLLIAAVCGVGVTTMASTNKIGAKQPIQVNPVNLDTNITNKNNIKDEIVKDIESNYGANWANDLYNKNGDDWDDVLEAELKNKFGNKYEDIIENIIEVKENEAGLDDDRDDINDDRDDMYDDRGDSDDRGDDNDDTDDKDDINDDFDDRD